MRLRSKLIISYIVVVLIAVIASGALALPMLQDYQNKRYNAEVERTVRAQADALGQAINRILSTDPNKALFRESLPTGNGANQKWPITPPALDDVRDAITREARGQRIVVVRARLDRERLVLVDTEPDSSKSWQGINLPARRTLALPTATPTGGTATVSPTNGIDSILVNNVRYYYNQPDKSDYFILFRPVGGGGPNLFGLNGQGKPENLYYAAVFPVPPQPDVIGDMLLNLSISGLVALVVSLIAGLLLARSISGPLVRLTDASQAVAKGDYSHTVPPQGGYELAHLAESFNHMSNEIEAYQRMQRELIGNVSHELKTPLTTILGFSQAMVDGALKRPEDFAPVAEIIHGETERMIRLVQSLLDLSKLESGQVQMARSELNLQEILEKAVTSFGPRAQATGVRLVSELEPLPPTLGDNDRLRQVFNNLIDNALKYTPAGGTVTVACRSDGRNIVVTVSDTGAGISEEDLRHIFERFYQANKARSREVEGVGLGLAITREIVNAHGGKIEAQSKVGRGSRFIVMLPALSPKVATLPEERERTKTLINR